MGRYRPPPREKAPYITPEGERRLRRELDHLWRVERPRVTRAVAEAAAQGDRSENAEYIYGKKQLYAIDRRVRYLQKRLDVLKVVDNRERTDQQAWFGAWVSIETEAGKQETYRIVGPDEINPEQGFVSVESPFAKAVLGKRVGDEFSFRRPAGLATCVLQAVRYQSEGGPTSNVSDDSD